jgi:hypothetical protein
MLPGLMLPATVPGAHLPADVSNGFSYSVLQLHMSRFQQSVREASMRQSKLQAGLAEQRAKVAELRAKVTELTESARVSATRTEEAELKAAQPATGTYDDGVSGESHPDNTPGVLSQASLDWLAEVEVAPTDYDTTEENEDSSDSGRSSSIHSAEEGWDRE